MFADIKLLQKTVLNDKSKKDHHAERGGLANAIKRMNRRWLLNQCYDDDPSCDLKERRRLLPNRQ
jgi:hypothetical protein